LDRPSRRRLAEHGLAAFPPSRLSEEAEECWAHGVATGDARWCILARTLARLAAPFDEDGQLSKNRVEQLDRGLRTLLPDVLDAPGAVEGSSLAAFLDRELGFS
jgi:hypothetical protein